MGLVKDGSLKLSSYHLVSFLLGAALPTFLLLLASDRMGEHLSSSVSGSWLASNGGTPGPAAAPHQHEVISQQSKHVVGFSLPNQF